MSINTFKEGDKVIVTQEGSNFKNVPQTVVGMNGDYVRIRLDEDAAGHSAGLVSSWLPNSLYKLDPRIVVLFRERSYHGGMEIKNDSEYPQVWVSTIHGSGARGPEFNLDVEKVTELRDALDAWLKGWK